MIGIFAIDLAALIANSAIPIIKPLFFIVPIIVSHANSNGFIANLAFSHTNVTPAHIACAAAAITLFPCAILIASYTPNNTAATSACCLTTSTNCCIFVIANVIGINAYFKAVPIIPNAGSKTDCTTSTANKIPFISGPAIGANISENAVPIAPILLPILLIKSCILSCCFILLV